MRGLRPKETFRRSRAWLEAELQRLQASQNAIENVELAIEGIHCTGCVWLLQESFRRRPGAGDVLVDPLQGGLRARFDPKVFDFQGWVDEVESFGYRLYSQGSKPVASSHGLLVRFGIVAALALQGMLFGFAFHFGLNRSEGEVYHLFSGLTLAISAMVVLVGGEPFFRAAWQGLRRGLAHLDLPIATGIGLVFLISLVQWLQGAAEQAYFDSFNVFVALMLAGRLLEQRALERNRGFLRSEESFGSLWVRRLSGGIATLIPSREVEPGDQLLIAPGEWVPVQSRLLSSQAWISREWMTGESQVEVVPSQSDLEAGSLNAGTETFQAEALEPFESSRLVSLLEVPSGRIEPDSGPPRFWHLVGRFWVAAVFLCAGFGALLWWKEGLDSTLRVVAAVLVVTCPCAVGIAIPLARKLATSRLRRQGCWIRNEGVLERVGAIRKVVFDKTGTLTISGLRQGFLEKLAVLPEEAIQAAYNLALGSRHPRIRGLADLLVPLGGRYHEGITVTELPGLGCETRLRDKTWRLGKAA
jgi:Cu2+-exporting ATPase